MDDTVPDTPIRNKNVVHSTPPGSVVDDAEYETIATLPANPPQHLLATQALSPIQRLTQPTQLVEQPYSAKGNSIVQ
ncbi:hypothetical protein COL922a_014486, partial [Colletotrichum nupharicola]